MELDKFKKDCERNPKLHDPWRDLFCSAHIALSMALAQSMAKEVGKAKLHGKKELQKPLADFRRARQRLLSHCRQLGVFVPEDLSLKAFSQIILKY